MSRIAGRRLMEPPVRREPDKTSPYPIPPNHVLWGQTVPVLPTADINLNSATQTTLLQTEAYAEAVDWHLEVAASDVPTGPFGSGLLIVFVTYTLGQAQVTKSYQVRSTNPRPIHINSRYVQVSAAWFAYASGSKAPINFTIGAGVGGVVDRPLSSTLPQWLMGSASNAGEVIAPAGAYPNGGQLQRYQASIVTMTGDAVAYVLFFDSAAAVTTPGALAIWTSQPFTAVDQFDRFDDSREPQIVFSKGLAWALSSTPNILTASSGSGVACVNVKAGQ